MRGHVKSLWWIGFHVITKLQLKASHLAHIETTSKTFKDQAQVQGCWNGFATQGVQDHVNPLPISGLPSKWLAAYGYPILSMAIAGFVLEAESLGLRIEMKPPKNGGLWKNSFDRSSRIPSSKSATFLLWKACAPSCRRSARFSCLKLFNFVIQNRSYSIFMNLKCLRYPHHPLQTIERFAHRLGHSFTGFTFVSAVWLESSPISSVEAVAYTSQPALRHRESSEHRALAQYPV